MRRASHRSVTSVKERINRIQRKTKVESGFTPCREEFMAFWVGFGEERERDREKEREREKERGERERSEREREASEREQVTSPFPSTPPPIHWAI